MALGTNFFGLAVTTIFPIAAPAWTALATAGAIIAGTSVVSTGVLENTVYANERKARKEMHATRQADQELIQEVAPTARKSKEVVKAAVKSNAKEVEVEETPTK